MGLERGAGHGAGGFCADCGAGELSPTPVCNSVRDCGLLQPPFWDRSQPPHSPVSCVTAVAASASVASVTMSSEATVTMLTSPPSSGSRIFMPALPWCTVFTWERRLSTRLKPRPHLSHRNGFSPGGEMGSEG